MNRWFIRRIDMGVQEIKGMDRLIDHDYLDFSHTL